jgi:hypothetical protein
MITGGCGHEDEDEGFRGKIILMVKSTSEA